VGEGSLSTPVIERGGNSRRYAWGKGKVRQLSSNGSDEVVLTEFNEAAAKKGGAPLLNFVKKGLIGRNC